KGWIEARYLLLSIYSLKTEGDVSVPRKAIILTSLDDMIEGNIKMDDVLEQKHYYHQPQPKVGTEKGTPNSFTIMFVMKEQDGSVLLSNTDVLNGSIFENPSKVYGWMPKSNITKWNSRVALEPARSADAISEYSGEKLPGYKDLNKLESCVQDNFCDKNERFVEFRVEEIRANRMRKPILSPINDNVREIVSIAKNSSELGEDQVEIYNDILEKLNRKSQMTNIVFAVDATKSMRKYFSAVASSINKIIDNNERLNQHQLKFGLVVYRDYADENDAFSYESLTSDFERIQIKVNNTPCFSSRNDRNLAEAQYNGLIKGVNALNLDPTESNVVILIGDCGNHNPDPKGLVLNDVVKVFHKNNINLISYQVKNNFDDSYFTFNEDAQDFIIKTADKIIEGKETTLKANWKSIGNNTYKLDMTQSENDFENMFGRFIYANANRAMNPTYLEESIVETLSEYMKSVDKNIRVLRAELSGTGGPLIDTETPPEGLIVHIMNKFNCSREDAIDFLNKTEVTTKAFVAIDYNGNGVDAQVPVVFLTENEKITLVNSLQTLTSGNCVTKSEKKKCLKENLIRVCK
ncbi:MAG: VWA domain-containing protein, partial [Flavobacteriales bacterium]